MLPVEVKGYTRYCSRHVHYQYEVFTPLRGEGGDEWEGGAD